MQRVTRAITDSNREWLKGWLAATFDVAVSETMLSKWITAARAFLGYRHSDNQVKHVPTKSGYGWRIFEFAERQWMIEDYADDDWRMWFSNRLREVGKWPKTGGGQMQQIEFLCPMHVFFIGLEETDEMLKRLRLDPEKPNAGPSSPGIERTNVKVQPIDCVAARVVPKGR